MVHPVQQIPSIQILGTRVHMVQMADTLHLMERWIQDDQGCRYIIASNLHAILEAHKHKEFRAVVNAASLFVPDGISATWVARFKGSPVKSRVRGTDLMRAFCELASHKGYSSFFYGNSQEVLNMMSARLRDRFPNLKIAGLHSPPFHSLTAPEDAQVTEMINQAKPDVLWVGLGCPKQERWMFEHRDKLNVPVMVGVGAAFNFLSGRVKEAPSWMRNHNLEWAWRMVHEPRRVWRRVLVYGPQFASFAFLEVIGLKKYG